MMSDYGLALLEIDGDVKVGGRLSGDLGVGYRNQNWYMGFHGNVETVEFKYQDLVYDIGQVSGRYSIGMYF